MNKLTIIILFTRLIGIIGYYISLFSTFLFKLLLKSPNIIIKFYNKISYNKFIKQKTIHEDIKILEAYELDDNIMQENDKHIRQYIINKCIDKFMALLNKYYTKDDLFGYGIDVRLLKILSIQTLLELYLMIIMIIESIELFIL